MASVEHCLYCFDVLTTTLEDKDTAPISLERIQETWPSYSKSLDDNIDAASLEPDYDINTNDPLNKDEIDKLEAAADKVSRLRLPALQRLGRSSNSPASSSTPSSSSSTSLAPSTTATTPDPFSSGSLDPRISQRRTSITTSPLFVTWNTVSPTSLRSLRGCIGTFEPQNLSIGLEQYTLISALQDTRFSPITTSELPSLEVSVTLLTDFEKADDQLDWELGIHGLKINFTVKNRQYGACYLPDVPVEQGWTKEETVISLMRKAGWTGRRDKWREVSDFRATRFQGKAESLKWEEYNKWKKWVEIIDKE
ncbi:hypothetical protein ONS95_008995 [Cadophora gregata]|uniref:uncharacterized protein n=1 Tax=Cadophora gregata TaxID=51156 RepID=UPI0026DD81F8|nr:uncharacterized protein ONS95_008995 [Cadophora gregata]KAK0124006.1 hypothetical protein ONS95_008995 [Cadophora gregata]KAK0130344.1 hypothetical protein ONS96_000866 [Cadophora gregata f. sp. sojae]